MLVNIELHEARHSGAKAPHMELISLVMPQLLGGARPLKGPGSWLYSRTRVSR